MPVVVRVCVCVGTTFHVVSLMKNLHSDACCSMLLGDVQYGVPETVVVDQGGTFESILAQTCEDFEVDIRIAGSHASWQQDLVEKHGVLVGEVWSKVVYEFAIQGRGQAKLALALRVQAKHATGEVRCHPRTGCVGKTSEVGLRPLRTKMIPSCSPP